MGDMEGTPMATVIKAMAAMAMVETKDMEVATDMAVARVMAPAKAMEETMAATRAMVAATEATRATVVTKGMTRTRATEEIKDTASSLMAATKDTGGNRAVTITRATA